jgi:hypothetical protein
MSTSDFSPDHRALPRIFANPKESQLAEITQLLFQSGSKLAYHRSVRCETISLIEQLDSAESPRDIRPAETPDVKVFTLSSQSISTSRDAASQPADVFPSKKTRADTCMIFHPWFPAGYCANCSAKTVF